jgi:spore coat-associated protein N
MTRLDVLARRPKQTLGALAALLLAVGIAIGSGAAFTAESANPNNVFTAGTLSMSNSKSAAAILTADDLVPGDSASGTVDIENTGDVAGDFSLSRTDLVDSDTTNPMSQKLDLVVTDCGTDLDCSAGTNPEKYNGTLAAMNSAIVLGSFAPADEHRYDFEVTFNNSAGDAYEGDSSSATFEWDATT